MTPVKIVADKVERRSTMPNIDLGTTKLIEEVIMNTKHILAAIAKEI